MAVWSTEKRSYMLQDFTIRFRSQSHATGKPFVASFRVCRFFLRKLNGRATSRRESLSVSGHLVLLLSVSYVVTVCFDLGSEVEML